MKKFLLSLMCCFLILGLATGCDKEKENGDNPNKDNNKTETSGKIKQIDISINSIIALTEEGDLYAIGDTGNREFGLGDIKFIDEVTKIATNVKSFNTTATTYYIDNNNDLYRAGLNFSGGVIEEFEKMHSNVSKAYNGQFYIMYFDLNNNLYAQNGSFSSGYGGLSDKYNEPILISNDVKTVIVSRDKYSGYVNSKDELYIADSSNIGVYEKRFDNISKISLDGRFILTKDKNLYIYDQYNKIYEKIAEQVVDIIPNEKYMLKEDGKYYSYDERNKTFILVDENVASYETLYNLGNITVYLNENNEIILYNDGSEYKKLENNVSNLKEIFNFIS